MQNGTTHHAGLTEDELQFIGKSKAMKTKMRQEEHESRRKNPDRRNRKPRIPRKSMVAVLIITVLLCVAILILSNMFEPYVGTVSSLMNLSEAGALGQEGEDVVQQAQTLSNMYQYRNTAIMTVAISGVVLEVVLYLQWVMRMNAWEEKRRAKRSRSKYRDDMMEDGLDEYQEEH